MYRYPTTISSELNCEVEVTSKLLSTFSRLERLSNTLEKSTVSLNMLKYNQQEKYFKILNLMWINQ